VSHVARVATPDGDVAVKTFAPADLARAEREAAIIRHLGGRHRTQTLVETRSQGSVVVTRWLLGRKKVYTEISEPEWRALGTSLAALHDVLDDLAFALPALPPVGDLGAARARVTAPDITRYLDARLALFERSGESARRVPDADVGPIHGDYNQHNYLFDDDLPPIVLDWDRALSAPRAYDVVRCLNHLPLVAPAHATAFVSGYREVRALDGTTMRWAVDRMLVDHATKSWPLERWLAGEQGAEAMLRGSMEIVHALAEGSVRLASFYEDLAR
jgi:Ser/Thr protein kinase RdoA (MazF antagonist)